jgi:hypothetical protein
MNSNLGPRGICIRLHLSRDDCPITGPQPELRLKQGSALYAGTTVATVKLPTQPFVEFIMAAGIRSKIATIDFDFGMTYSLLVRLRASHGGICFSTRGLQT